MDAAPPATRAVASRGQAQHAGRRLQPILGSKATVTARPGQAPLLCQLTRVHSGKKPLGPTQCQGLGVIWDQLVVAALWPHWEGSGRD